MRMISFALLSVILTSPAAVASDKKMPPDRPPSLMTSTEIRAYNEGLDATHPYYIKCRKDPVVGTLVRKLRVCRTNEQWKQFAATGNDSGREVLDDMIKAPVSGNAPAFEACPAGRC